MLKIFLDGPLPSRDSFTVDDEFWNYYLTTVKRLGRGDRLEVAGETMVAETTVRSEDPLRVDVEELREASTPGYRLHLAQSITRKQKFEEAIKYGTELGITHFTPLVSERTVREPNNPEKQLRRWKKIAMDSARITERDWLPAINDITPLDTLFPVDEEHVFFGEETGEDPGDAFGAGQESALLIVGPEGGFTEPEQKQIVSSGGRGVSLGQVNYRAETASFILSTLWLTAAAPDRDRGERRSQSP